MPKRSIEKYRPTGIRFRDEPFYSEGDIDRIIESAGGLPDGNFEIARVKADASGFEDVVVSRRTALKERLESAARAWHWESQKQIEPTAEQLSAAFTEIQKAAERLLETMHIPVTGGIDRLPSALRYGGLQAMAAFAPKAPGETSAGLLRSAIVGVCRLRAWSRILAHRERRRARLRPRKQRREPDAALNSFIKALGGIWFEVFERPIKTSVNASTHKATGRFVSFVVVAVRPLGIVLSPDAARDRIRQQFRLRPKGKSTPARA
jgi:hypothetical protein